VRMRIHMHTTHTSARAQTRMHPGTRGPGLARTHAPAHEHVSKLQTCASSLPSVRTDDCVGNSKAVDSYTVRIPWEIIIPRQLRTYTQIQVSTHRFKKEFFSKGCSSGRENSKILQLNRSEIGTTNAPQCQVPV